MRLLLIRHGNTFEAGQTPVRVGANEDLPLTATGENQAHALAAALNNAGIRPDAVIAGPLIRTRRHAEVILEDLRISAPLQIDRRLTEIDYGPWGGLSDADIVARFGDAAAQELAAWEKESRWPTETAQWHPGAEAVIRGVAELSRELEMRLGANGTAFVCSSNGILRYFLELVPGGLATAQRSGRAKMSTGAASLLELTDGKARVLFWNLKAGTELPVTT